MKKYFLTMIALFAMFVSVLAQPPGGGDPDAMKARMKERVKPMLIEKTSISDQEAEKVMDIYFDFQMKTRPIRMDQSMSEEDKSKKIEATDARDKSFKEIPLTDEKIKSVSDFFEELRKQMQNRGGGQPRQ
jgi:putative cell wall-binding protein